MSPILCSASTIAWATTWSPACRRPSTVVTVRWVPDLFTFHLINHSMSDFAGMPVLNLSGTPLYGLNRAVKWLEDKILASLILLLVTVAVNVLARVLIWRVSGMRSRPGRLDRLRRWNRGPLPLPGGNDGQAPVAVPRRPRRLARLTDRLMTVVLGSCLAVWFAAWVVAWLAMWRHASRQAAASSSAR